MRQAGLTASCALVALEDWEERLAQDNYNARYLANALQNEVDGVSCDVTQVQTNMLAFVIDSKITAKGRNKAHMDHIGLCKVLGEKHNILLFPSFNNDAIRVVTHRDVNTEDMERTKEAI